MGPIPGMPISRRAPSSCLARLVISDPAGGSGPQAAQGVDQELKARAGQLGTMEFGSLISTISRSTSRALWGHNAVVYVPLTPAVRPPPTSPQREPDMRSFKPEGIERPYQHTHCHRQLSINDVRTTSH